MSAKLGFAAGLAVGLLAGSRAGRGLYDRSSAAASAVVHDPRVRSGATSALHKAGNAGSSVAGAAARKVKSRGKSHDGNGAEGAEGNDGERQRAALRGRTKRLIGGVRKHGIGVNGHGHGHGHGRGHGHGTGMKIGRPHLRLNGTDHSGNSHDAAENGDMGGMSAPYVEPRPKDGRQGE